MKFIIKIIRGFTTIFKWGALLTIAILVLLITYSVIMDGFHLPIIGDYELVQLLMVVLISLGLAYAQYTDSHIKIGLLVDRFSEKLQNWLNLFTYILTVIVTIFIGIIQIKGSIFNFTTFRVTTEVLTIPLYPFIFLMGIGFILWGLEALVKAINTIEMIFKSKEKNAGIGGNNIYGK